MTQITDACPSYFMPVEKRAFARGWRDGCAGKEQGRSKYPNAYSRGYWEGRAALDALQRKQAQEEL